jgi:hypothetical protein
VSIDYLMADANDHRRKPPSKPDGGRATDRPEWAKGLKRMYDSVVEEPLPDAFKDLLSRLDDSQS